MSNVLEKVSPSGLTRRSFLQTTGVIAAGAALGSTLSACSSSDSSTANLKSSSGDVVKTVSCCWTCVYCEYNAVVRDGHVVKLEPMEGGNKRGSRMCLRGRSRFRMLYNPNRVKYPMKRVGERGDGQWERISWDEAISAITTKWNAYQKEFGNNSVAYYWGSGNVSALGSGNYGGLLGRLAMVKEFTYIDYATDMALGYGTGRVFGAGASQNQSYDIKNADKVFMWGSSYTDSWWQLWWPLADAIEAGTRLYTIDPSYSTTASKSHKWISNKAGTDGLILLGVMNYLVENKLYNKDFLLNHTTAAVLVRTDNKKLLRMSDLGTPAVAGPPDPATGQPTVIDPPVVWDTAANNGIAYDKAGSPALTGNFTVQGIACRTSFDYLSDELKKWTPQVAADKAGVTVEEIEFIAKEQATGNVYNIPGYASAAYANGGEFGHALAMMASLTGSVGRPGASCGATWWGYPINAAFMVPTGTFANQIPVLAMPSIMETGKLKGKDYPIKSLFIAAGNPMGSSASTSDIKKWWDKIEFVVVSDLQFTDSANYADIVLPSTHALETEDLVLASYFPYIGITEKTSEPPFETKRDAELARLLANGLGVGEHFNKSDDDYLREILDEAPTSQKLGITVERLRKEKEICWDDKGIQFEGAVFPTETGRANIYLDTVAPRVDYGQELDPTVGHVPTWFPPHEAWADNEVAKKYPLVLNSQRLRTRWHTGEFENAWMLEISPEPIVKINPIDAKARDIADGSYVEVFNDRGHAVAKAEFDEGRHPGVLIYPKGWQNSQFIAGNWCELTSAYPDPFAVNTSFMDVAVDVRPWKGKV